MGLFDFLQQQKDGPSHHKTIPSLIEDLGKNKPKNVREHAHETLVASGPEAIVPLSEALNSEDWRIREEAAKILGQIGDERAVVALIQLFKDEKTRVQLWATDSLISMGKRAATVSPVEDRWCINGSLRKVDVSENPTNRISSQEGV